MISGGLYAMTMLHTKERILHHAASLFAEGGYDSVSVKTIACAAGIKPASIYNHYDGKEAILEAIYRIFESRIFECRMTPEEYEPIIRAGTIREIVAILNYPLKEPVEIMFNAIRIVFGRISMDPTARRMYRELVQEAGFAYVTTLLETARRLDRIRLTDREIENLAHMMNGLRIYTSNAVVIDPDQAKWRKVEVQAMDEFSNILSAYAHHPPKS